MLQYRLSSMHSICMLSHLSASSSVYIVRISSNVRATLVHPVAVSVTAPERCDLLVTQHAIPHRSRVYLHIPQPHERVSGQPKKLLAQGSPFGVQGMTGADLAWLMPGSFHREEASTVWKVRPYSYSFLF